MLASLHNHAKGMGEHVQNEHVSNIISSQQQAVHQNGLARAGGSDALDSAIWDSQWLGQHKHSRAPTFEQQQQQQQQQQREEETQQRSVELRKHEEELHKQLQELKFGQQHEQQQQQHREQHREQEQVLQRQQQQGHY